MGLTQVSTKGIKDATILDEDIAPNTITAARLGNDCVGTGELQNSAVETINIQDQAVDLTKLPHGTSSNDGKFLRANNGADPTFETVTSTTINGNTDHRIITATGTANTLQGESSFTHNPSTFDTTILHSTNTSNDLIIQNDSSGTAAGARLTLQSGSNANTGPQEQFIVGSHSWLRQVPKSSGNMTLAKNGTNHTTFAADGDLVISDGDLVIGTSGHGIDFSATGNAAGASGESELLNDYEEGDHTVGVFGSGGASAISVYASENKLSYNKIGNLVTVKGRIRMNEVSFSGSLRISLPYTVGAQSNTNNAQMCAVATHGVDFDSTAGTGSHMGMFLEPIAGTALGEFSITRDNSAWAQATNSNIVSGSYLAFVLIYTSA